MATGRTDLQYRSPILEVSEIRFGRDLPNDRLVRRNIRCPPPLQVELWFQAPFAFSSGRPTTFVSPHSRAFAPQRSSAVGSAFSAVRIVSSVKSGSSHCVVGLKHTRLSLSPRPTEYPTADEYTPTVSQCDRVVLTSMESMDLRRKGLEVPRDSP